MNTIIEMETRSCIKCARVFKVRTISAQTHCSQACEKWGHKWADQKKASKDVEPKRESVVVSVTTPTLSTGSKRPRGLSFAGDFPESRRLREARATTNKTEKASLSDDEDGPKRIENDNLKPKGNIMPDTKSDLEIVSTKEEKSINLPMVSTVPSPSVQLVESPSMSLLDSTAQHLHGLMKGLTANKLETDVRTYDIDTVHAACHCAKNIREIMKLKLEAFKVQKEVE